MAKTVKITITGVSQQFTITWQGEHYEAYSGTLPTTISSGGTLQIRLKPSANYKFTNQTTVQITGMTGQGAMLTWDEYQIAANTPSGNVTIKVTGVVLREYFAITNNITHVHKVSGPDTVQEFGGAELTYAADTGWLLPEPTPTVVGATVGSWDKDTGILIIENAVGQ